MSQNNFETKCRLILKAMYDCRSKTVMNKLVREMKRLERDYPKQAQVFWNGV